MTDREAGWTLGKPTAEELAVAFEREARAVGAGVVRVAAGEVAATVAELLTGARSIVAAAGLDDLVARLLSRGLNVMREEDDAGLAVLPAAEAGLGVALLGVAASGSVLVGPCSGGGDLVGPVAVCDDCPCGEGLISILPPRFVVLLPAARVVPDLREALVRAAPLVAGGAARLVFVTGPSRTADIELTSVIGAHGPLRLDVVLVDE